MKYLPWVIVTSVSLLLAGILLFGAMPMRVGVLDMGQVIDESPRAEELNRRLTERYNQLIAEIRANDEFDEEEQVRREREAYSEYLRFRQELEYQFQAEVDRAVAEVARRKRLQIVLDEDVVRHGGVDISADIVNALR